MVVKYGYYKPVASGGAEGKSVRPVVGGIGYSY